MKKLRWSSFIKNYTLKVRDVAWKEEIDRMLEQDEENPPSEGGIVFTGSSSIAKWKALGEDMEPLPTIRRGFGGSTILDSVHFAGKIIIKYKPRMVVLYAGDNDIYFYDKYQFKGDMASKILDDFNLFTRKIHEILPETWIYYLSIKPSSSRVKLWPKMKAANDLVAERVKSDDRLHYIDLATPLLKKNGKANDEFFIRDKLHLNKKGYQVWTSILKPILERDYSLLSKNAGND